MMERKQYLETSAAVCLQRKKVNQIILKNSHFLYMIIGWGEQIYPTFTMTNIRILVLKWKNISFCVCHFVLFLILFTVWFDFLSRHWLCWHIFMVFLSSSRQMLRFYLNVNHDRFLPCPSPFTNLSPVSPWCFVTQTSNCIINHFSLSINHIRHVMCNFKL